MPINTSGAIGAPLTVYGSWVTDVSPDALPENVSPDNQEIVYSAGQFGSRAALQKVPGITFPPVGGVIPTAVYSKSFVTPTLDIQNLHFDSAGRLWMEDLSNTPGTITLLFQSTPGSYCKSITKFGREYIAISDGLHGADVPLQWDGTYLDRFTQGGPGAAPIVTSVSFPQVSVAVGGAAPAATIVTITQSGIQDVYIPYSSSTLTVTFTAPVSFQGGSQMTITGNSQSLFNTTASIIGISGAVVTLAEFLPWTSPGLTGTGGSASAVSAASLIRSNNFLTGFTSSAHNLRVGYQALLQGNGVLALGGGITSIVINNEDEPGIATVTTASAHGLSVQDNVTITGVQPAGVGAGGSWSAIWNGTNVTLTLSSGVHGLVPGAVIQVTDSAAPTSIFVGSFTVASTPQPNSLVYDQASSSIGTSSVTATGLTVSITWPVPDNTPTPTYFEVQACPSPTTFQVQVTYCDGTWSSGAVSFSWDGTFYITQVPSATSFICQSPGPNGSTTETAGTVTPFGQCGAGLHLVAMCGITRQGAITAPGPFSTFISNGGQYLSVSNILPGASNWVGRILLFTGAQPDVPGELPPFYYIPVTPMLEGQIVGTATQINDNVTTSALLDFSDNTLYAAIGASIPGNNLANQIVMDGALGFRTFLSRLLTNGQRNNIQNLLNMGFDADAAGVTAPQGWTVTGTNPPTVVSLSSRPAGGQLQFIATHGTGVTTISQSAYQDCYGDPILSPNQIYKLRLWAMTNGVGGLGYINWSLASVSTGYNQSSYAIAPAIPGYIEITLSAETPDTIPADMLLSVWVSNPVGGPTVTIDELQPIPTETPYLDQISNASYVNNPEGIDGDTGQWGPQDTAKIMDMGIVRGTLYILTQAPGGKLHYTDGSATTEPSGWDVEPVAGECGALSAFCLTTSQADDSSEAGGEDWMAWASDVGAMIYGGGLPEKISQEIQPNWLHPTKGSASVQINMGAALPVWGLNDPVSRLLMFGLPIGSATAPSQIYVLNYEHLGGSQAIASSPPFHPSFAGKLIATDNSRKWTHWLRPMNGAARMYRSAGELTNVFFGGNGQTLGAAAGYGNIYTLNPAKFTDDDFGQIFPYYDTYFFVDPERRQQMQLKNGRLLLAYVLAQIQPRTGDTNSQVTLTYYGDNLANPWPLTTTRVLTPNFWKDRNFGGGMAQGERIAIRIASSPITGTDNSFTCSRFEAFLRNARLLVSGVNQ